MTLSPILDRLLPGRRKASQQAPTQSQEPTPPPKPVYTLPAAPPEPIRVRAAQEQTGPIAAATGVVANVLRNRLVARTMAVVDIFGQAGGGLFAAALAYSTMFALIPLVLLMAGVLGWLVDDPAQREQVLSQLIGYFPPLADFFSLTLDGLVAAKGALSIIGIVGLIWGASNFYAGLDEVMRRIFTGGGIRGMVDRRLRGIVTIVGLILLMIGTILLSSVFAFLNALAGQYAFVGFLAPIVTLAVFVCAVLGVYKLVPTAPPSLRAAFPAALLAGIGIGVLTTLFGIFAPWLIGGLSGLGVIATAFGVLIWLNFSYQILLYGAAWARVRRDLERDRASVVAI